MQPATTPVASTPRLWVDTHVILDANSGDQAYDYFLPREQYIEFGAANQAFFTIESYVYGPARADVDLYVMRTRDQGYDDGDQFEDMNAAGISLPDGHGWTNYTFGRGPNTNNNDLFPRGVGSLRLNNTSSTDFADVRIRVWVTLQRYLRRGYFR